MEKLDGASGVETAITLGTPNRGTKMAALGLFETASQFRPDSALITELAQTPSSCSGVNMVSVWSDFDNVVLPAENASLPEPCTNIVVSSVGHVALLFSRRVFDHVCREIAGSRAA